MIHFVGSLEKISQRKNSKIGQMDSSFVFSLDQLYVQVGIGAFALWMLSHES